MNRVECYAGSTYPEKPRALIWEAQRYLVQGIISRSREPEGYRFMVRCSPGNAVFDLFYDLIEKEWQIQPKGFIPNKGSSKHSPNNTGD